MPKRATAAKTTTDHDEIRRWVEARGGCPAAVKSTKKAGDPGLIRIDYTGFSGQQTLTPISWREFFEAFEHNDLAFLYQERTASGRPSRFSKLVKRSAANNGRSSGQRSRARSTVRKAPSQSSSGRRAGAKLTTDHDRIRRWVEARGGCPAAVKRTRGKNEPGIIRIDYTGFSGKDSLEKISWSEFFRAFEQNELAFLYQDKTASGRPSRFSKLVARGGQSGRGRANERSRPNTKTTSARGRSASAGRRSATKTKRGRSRVRSTAR